jgi:phage/plasmid-like protein (TIGR03299 family)
MFYAGEAPWHRLGIQVPTEVTSAEAMRLAGLDWQVETVPVVAQDSTSPVEGYRAVVRSTDRRALGIVGERYRPIQNSVAFDFFDELVGSGQAIYHTAGALNGGRRVWILAKLPGSIRVAGDDVTDKFLLLTNSHDGTTALRMLFTPVRVVCQNTLNLSLRRGLGEGVSIRHTSSATLRIDEARRALGIANAYFEDFATTADQLVRSKYHDRQMGELAETLFPTIEDQPSARILKTRENVISLFAHGKGHGAIRGTAWAALNAVAEYADHHRVIRAANEVERAESRLSSVWFGRSAALKQQAHEVILRQLAA